MAFETESLAKAAFKKTYGKTHTTNNKDLANESVSSSFTLTFEKIYGEALPALAADAVTESKAVAVTLDLVEDATATGFAYFTAAQAGSDILNYVNPETGVNYQVGERVQKIIPSSFGASYSASLLDNGNVVSPLDSRDWFLDEFAGVVVSENPLNLGSNGSLTGYVYVGKMLSETVNDISQDVNSIEVSLQAAFNTGQVIDMDGYAGGLSISSTVEGGFSVDAFDDVALKSNSNDLLFGDQNNAEVKFSDVTETYGTTLMTSRQSLVGAINEAFLSGGSGALSMERCTFEVTSQISSATGLTLDGSQAEVSIVNGAINLSPNEGYEFTYVKNVEVFVNGMLVINDDVTYNPVNGVQNDVAGDLSSNKIYFAFDLQEDDVIQIINNNPEVD